MKSRKLSGRQPVGCLRFSPHFDSKFPCQNTELIFRPLLRTQKTNFEKYLSFGFSLIQYLEQYYKSADLVVKQKIIGLIFPEKLIFEDKQYRTTKPNPILELITLNINELGVKRKDFPEINSEKSYLVDPLGLEPRTTVPKTAVLPITPWVKRPAL